MMKSIFLSADDSMLGSSPTSNNITTNEGDNDYILVEVTDSEAEEEDYDYCEDAISEGLQEQQPYFCASFTSSLREAERDRLLQEVVQSEPSIQHILDEAHKSASQLELGDDPEKQEHLDKVPGILESSASDVSEQEENIPSLPPITPTTIQPQQSITPPICAAVGGRMSNKKRRKKMKLLKKAAAAAKAAAALSSDREVPHTTTTTSSTTKKTRPKVTRYHQKRVANKAVACATETLANYKVQLHSSSKKVQ